MTVTADFRSTTVDTHVAAPAPYRRGERVQVDAPDGTTYLARVEEVWVSPAAATDWDAATAAGLDFTVVAAVVAPRRFRNQLITTRVAADGNGPFVRPVRATR